MQSHEWAVAFAILAVSLSYLEGYFQGVDSSLTTKKRQSVFGRPIPQLILIFLILVALGMVIYFV